MRAKREKRFADESVRIDFVAAAAAGLTASLVTLAFDLFSRRFHPYYDYVWYPVLGVLAYSLAAFLLLRVWRGWAGRPILIWLPISILGSMLFVMVTLAPGVIGGWYDPLRLEPSFRIYALRELRVAISVVIGLSALTGPIAGLVFLCFFLIRHWKNGTDTHGVGT